ncbi:hypothetical protein GGS21DRAFT_490238 [Xylaria nigripes]|nr:hypothetical protein GGS21DRAFT_490238 [Xylaria nigripes]
MRFTSFIVAGLFAVATSAQSSGAVETGSATATVSVDPAQSSAASKIEQCLAACDESDTACRAHCIAVPSPDTQNVNATTNCVANCPQGNGTAAENKAYADCVDGCIAEFYFTSTGTPNIATGAPGNGNSASGSVTHVSMTITSGGSTFVTDVPSTMGSGETNRPSSTSSHGAAAAYGPVGTGLGLFGILAGFLAL